MAEHVLIDTGPIVAIMNRNDAHHLACVEASHSVSGAMLTCWPVVTEAAWLLRRYPVAQRQLFRALSSPVGISIRAGHEEHPEVGDTTMAPSGV